MNENSTISNAYDGKHDEYGHDLPRWMNFEHVIDIGEADPTQTATDYYGFELPNGVAMVIQSQPSHRDHPFIVYSYGDGACPHDDVEFATPGLFACHNEHFRLSCHPSSTVEQSIQITCASNIRMMNMKHFAGAISTRRHTVISNTPHVSSTSATADFEKGSARMPAQPKTSLKAKLSISTTATSSRMRTDRIQRKSPQKGFGMNSAMPA